MNKGFKISFWILCGLACVLIASMCLIGLFSYFTHNFKKTQDGYFAKVEYSIEGHMTDNSYLMTRLCPH